MDFAYRIQSSLMVPDSYNGDERYHGKTEHVSLRPGRMLHCIKIHRAKLTTHCLLKEIILFKQPNGTFNQNIVLVFIDILVELLGFDIVCICYNIKKKGYVNRHRQ